MQKYNFFRYFFNDYCSYEVTSTKYSRDIYKELLVSLVASLFMGFGVLFLLLWVGIYVWQEVHDQRNHLQKQQPHYNNFKERKVLRSMAPLIVDTCILLKQNFLNDCNDNKEV